MSQKRILIVKMSSLGDILHGMPALRGLRKKFPEAYIAWALQVGEDLLSHDPDLDEVINLGRGKGLIGGFRWIRDVRKTLKRYNFNIALDIQGLAKSGLVSFLSGAKERIGFRGKNSREMNSLFMTHRYTPPEDVHIAAQNIYLLKHFDIEPNLDIPLIHTGKEDTEYINDLLERIGISGEYIVVNPGVSRSNKQWPIEHFAELCTMISEQYSYNILLTSGREYEYNVCKQINEASHGTFIMPRLSLGQFVSLIRSSVLFVGNDTGPSHIAYASGVPTVFLFGPTGAWRNGGYECETGVCVNIEPKQGCTECWRKTCSKEEFCMKHIMPDRVFQAVNGLLEEKGTSQDSIGENEE